MTWLLSSDKPAFFLMQLPQTQPDLSRISPSLSCLFLTAPNVHFWPKFPSVHVLPDMEGWPRELTAWLSWKSMPTENPRRPETAKSALVLMGAVGPRSASRQGLSWRSFFLLSSEIYELFWVLNFRATRILPISVSGPDCHRILRNSHPAFVLHRVAQIFLCCSVWHDSVLFQVPLLSLPHLLPLPPPHHLTVLLSVPTHVLYFSTLKSWDVPFFRRYLISFSTY